MSPTLTSCATTSTAHALNLPRAPWQTMLNMTKGLGTRPKLAEQAQRGPGLGAGASASAHHPSDALVWVRSDWLLAHSNVHSLPRDIPSSVVPPLIQRRTTTRTSSVRHSPPRAPMARPHACCSSSPPARPRDGAAPYQTRARARAAASRRARSGGRVSSRHTRAASGAAPRCSSRSVFTLTLTLTVTLTLTLTLTLALARRTGRCA